MTPHRSATPNPLVRRDPELLERLAALRDQAQEMLLVHLAAIVLGDPTFRADRRPHAPEDVQAVLHVLRVLTKPSWDADDWRLLDACWRAAIQTELFAEGFEAERHCLRRAIEEARTQRSSPAPNTRR